MILVTGAGGKTGRALIKSLSKAESLCAFAYRAEHISAVKALGAEKVIVGDLRDESSVRLAMEGVREVYHLCPNMSPDEIVIGKVVIREARNAGLEHFLYHSVLHPQTEKMNHHWQKLRWRKWSSSQDYHSPFCSPRRTCKTCSRTGTVL